MVMTLSYDSPGQLNQRPSPGENSQAAPSCVSLLGVDCFIRSQVSLANHTSYRVGGPAEWYVAPKTLDQMRASLQWAAEQGLSTTPLGGGSNLLISDQGLSGLVIGTRALRHTHFDLATGRLHVAAGESLPRIAWKAARLGWRGLEWAVGIPGTVGGAVVMNAGAHGSCTADMLVETEVLSSNGQLQVLTPQDLDYSYRSSNLQNSDRIVLQAVFQLQPGFDPAKVSADTSEQLHKRRSSQPYHLPSCGSVFRNPGPKAAGWLIEQTGLKGYQIGGAQVAERHANFIVNCGGATANDIFHLIRHVQEAVEQRWSYLLEPEVRIIGEF
ncbi:MAG: UDP-N-acetylmuramate dehydrogenase [Cyanobacteria bacterium J06592_8]